MSKNSSAARHETLFQRMRSLRSSIEWALDSLDIDDVTTARNTLRAALYDAKQPLGPARRSNRR